MLRRKWVSRRLYLPWKNYLVGNDGWERDFAALLCCCLRFVLPHRITLRSTKTSSRLKISCCQRGNESRDGCTFSLKTTLSKTVAGTLLHSYTAAWDLSHLAAYANSHLHKTTIEPDLQIKQHLTIAKEETSVKMAVPTVSKLPFQQQWLSERLCRAPMLLLEICLASQSNS